MCNTFHVACFVRGKLCFLFTLCLNFSLRIWFLFSRFLPINMDNQTLEKFVELANVMKVDMDMKILANVITLIRHGVQPDEIYHFFSEAAKNRL